MAYTIKNTDGTTLLLLGDSKVDSNSTSITLVGKNYYNYGEFWNNNLIKLMGHFSNTTAPTNPLKGQLWYDSLNKKLNVYDQQWEPLNGAQISNIEPSFLSNGDLWWDSVNNQLYIKTESATRLVGPAFSSLIGSNGWVLPSVAIQDNTNGSSGNVKQVTLLRNYGTATGYISNEKFDIANTSTYSYITNYTTSTVKGLTVFGDVRATETLYANTLTVTSSIVYPQSERVSQVVDLDFPVTINNLAFRVYTAGASFYPQMRAVTGTANVSYAGIYIKVTAGPLAISSTNFSLSTTYTDIIGSGIDFDQIGDMLQIILSDQTVDTNAGIRTYRITIQITGTGPKASITVEKLV